MSAESTIMEVRARTQGDESSTAHSPTKLKLFLVLVGMVKTYQLQKTGEYGQLLKIVPLTTESVINVNTCLQLNGSSEIGVIKPQSVIPDLTNFKVLFGSSFANEIFHVNN